MYMLQTTNTTASTSRLQTVQNTSKYTQRINTTQTHHPPTSPPNKDRHQSYSSLYCKYWDWHKKMAPWANHRTDRHCIKLQKQYFLIQKSPLLHLFLFTTLLFSTRANGRLALKLEYAKHHPNCTRPIETPQRPSYIERLSQSPT